MRTNVVAVVVTYNRKEMLLECIQRLLNQSVLCDVLIVDNASTDGTKQAIENLSDDCITYVNTGKNLGGAGGFNFGMKEAVARKYEYFWLMDDDTFPEQTALEELMKADETLNGQYGFLSGAVFWKDGSICNMNRQRVTLSKPIEKYTDEIKPVIMATFVSFFVRKEIVIEMGLPISEFFIWADDLEYSRRLSRKYVCYVVGKSHVIHAMASNAKVGIHQESEDRLWRYEYLYRNEYYLYRREGLKGRMYYWMRVQLHRLRIFKSMSGSRDKKLKVINESVKAGKTFNPKIEFCCNESSKQKAN